MCAPGEVMEQQESIWEIKEMQPSRWLTAFFPLPFSTDSIFSNWKLVAFPNTRERNCLKWERCVIRTVEKINHLFFVRVCKNKNNNILSSTKSWWEFLPKYIMLRGGKKSQVEIHSYLQGVPWTEWHQLVSACWACKNIWERPRWGSYCSENQLITFDICWSLGIQKRIMPNVLQKEEK